MIQSAEQKIKDALKSVDLTPRPTYTRSPDSTIAPNIQKPNASASRFGTGVVSDVIKAEREIKPEDFQPWMARYVRTDINSEPSIFYGNFPKPETSKSPTSHASLLDRPPISGNPNDPKVQKALKEQRKAEKLVGRLDGAREGALDYQVGGGQRSSQKERRPAMPSLQAWDNLVEERIQEAKRSGWFTNVPGRGQPIKRQAEELHIDSTQFYMNRIMKRQGARPPWIELQNELESAMATFRNNLLDSHVRAIVRSLITSSYHDQESLAKLTPAELSNLRDSAWENRERSYHEELVKNLNNLIRKMNAQAPQVVRRGLVVLPKELESVRREAGPIIYSELEKRRDPDWEKKRDGKGGGYKQEDNSGSGSGAFEGAWNLPKGNIALVFIGMGGLTYIVHHTTSNRRAQSQADSKDAKTNGPSSFIASSPAEDHVSSWPVRFVRMWIMEPIGTVLRFLKLVLIFGPVILASPMLLVGTTTHRTRRKGGLLVQEGERWGAVWWYGFLVRSMEKAGPTFIKLGQWAGSRADLFPASLCDQMGKLHANAKPHSLRYTKRVLSNAFQLPFNEIFDEFEPEPIGVGAIAQVYRAKLKRKLLPESFIAKRTRGKDPNTPDDLIDSSVAIKVVHPNVDKDIRRDLKIMGMFANAINLLPGMEWISLPEEVKVFGEMMNMQLDLRVEADNLEKFIHNFEKRGPGVHFPEPVKTNGGDASSKVLVEEYQDALPLKYFLKNGGAQYDAQIANAGLDAFLVSVHSLDPQKNKARFAERICLARTC